MEYNLYGFNTGGGTQGTSPPEETSDIRQDMLYLIHFYTFDRLRDEATMQRYRRVVEDCLFALTKAYKKTEGSGQAQAQGIKAETVGPHRIEYFGSNEEASRRSKEVDEYAKIIRVYFGHTGLMYRGVR